MRFPLIATCLLVAPTGAFVVVQPPNTSPLSCWHKMASSSDDTTAPTVVTDESASDPISKDNPPPGVKFIECPEDEVDMPFYTLGVNLAMQVGQNLGTLLTDRECDLVAKGFAEHLKGTLTKQGLDGQTILQNFGPAANQLLQERTLQQVDNHKQAGQEYADQFLKDHAAATQSDSGLIYLETQAGTTDVKPTLDSTIQFHYHGTMAVSGQVVDSSVVRGDSHTLPLNQAIPGLKEALLQMTEGTKATLVIPSDLAYGDAGGGQGLIPGGTTLQFEVELIKVVPASEALGKDDEAWNA
ncbi:FKBP-type 22 kDa peptidyl-prolyl cis-trans isomerase [Seminavis robusta]|uniref:peptidylprolyl isomerase n=1 Tax=Seminavis robusta TaxID=568900 RepID=A0A9N8F127_9STRA|nr:FKBP-type 22 kDa peptidyl-prolyl cis-trans isomerase [Seminavis robusta]|eukprot:Sro2447_g328020.1 FKBP-type 22 kDa peptidyl-prolyl cis-trans isomerase (298) ;mRNA; f:7737-8630